MLLRILILILLMLSLPDAYIYIMYIRRWTGKWWIHQLWWLPTAALLAAMAVIMSAGDMNPEHQSWVSMYMFAYLFVSAPKTLFALFDFIGWATHISKARHIARIIGMTLAFFAMFVLLYGYFAGRHRYVVHQQTFYFDDLPQAFDGYRIAQFSDMHIGTFRDGHEKDVRRIVDLINEQKCDVILFCGDIVNHKSSELDGFRRDLNKLSAKDGVFAVMGNHDYSMYIPYPDEQDRAEDVAELKRRIRSYGWTLLLNDHSVLRRGRDSIVIAGVENDGRPPFPSYGDLQKTMKGLKPGCFTVMLSHDPTHWRRKIIPQTNIQLTLSGHTHAGQLKVLGWSPVSHVYDEWSGAYTEGNHILNVSDGIGAVMFPFRFGAWPEVNVITLKKAQQQ